MLIPECTPLLSFDEIESIFSDGQLYEKESFFIIDKETKEYDLNKEYDGFLIESYYLRKAFTTGHTIIVRNLENFNKKIRMRAAELGRDVDVHMYLVPPNGEDSFDFHKDDRDVYVHMIYGEKTFILKRNDKEEIFNLTEGDILYIPKDTVHKAIPEGPSCQLSFGVDTRPYYSVGSGCIMKSDLLPSLRDA